jgi:hypothetical protein
MKATRFAALAAAAVFSVAAPAFAAVQGHGQAVVTLIPKGSESSAIQLQNLELKVDGKQSNITHLAPAKGPNSPLELVILVDGSARSSLGTQLGDIGGFVKEMPNNAKIAIAYMQNGRAALTGPLSSDPTAVLRGLHLPGGGSGTSASPYFCLSDLAKNWPSQDPSARREVVMITDGVDYYNPRFDPNDPYVQAAINDSIRSGLVVYSFYWLNRGPIDRSEYENNAGQSLLSELTQATGGSSYWQGSGNPVSFGPFFKDLRQRLQNQYKISFTSALKDKPELQRFSLKVDGAGAKIYAPQQVFVTRMGNATGE